MKKTFKILSFILVAAIMVLAFAGCQQSLDKTIIGKWTNEDNSTTIEFREDGTVAYDGYITFAGFQVERNFEGEYTIDIDEESAEITIFPDSSFDISFVDIKFTYTAVYEDDVLMLDSEDIDLTLSLTKVDEEK